MNLVSLQPMITPAAKLTDEEQFWGGVAELWSVARIQKGKAVQTLNYNSWILQTDKFEGTQAQTDAQPA